MSAECCACPGKAQTGVAFISHGMHVNDSVGKTEVLLRFDGTGAAAARDGLNTGTLKVTADNPSLGALTLELPNSTSIRVFQTQAHTNTTKRSDPG